MPHFCRTVCFNSFNTVGSEDYCVGRNDAKQSTIRLKVMQGNSIENGKIRRKYYSPEVAYGLSTGTKKVTLNDLERRNVRRLAQSLP